jgi:hypothetical protein
MSSAKQKNCSSGFFPFQDIDVRVIGGSFDARKIFAQFFYLAYSWAQDDRFFEMTAFVKAYSGKNQKNKTRDRRDTFPNKEPFYRHDLSFISAGTVLKEKAKE